MALYNEISASVLGDILAADEERRKKQQLADYAAKKAAVDNKYKTDNGGLGGFFNNLFKDVKSIGNTLATTLAAGASPVVQTANNLAMESTQEKSQKNLDAIAQKYGYKNKDDAYNKGDGPEEMWKEFQDSTNKTRKEQDKISNEFKNNIAVKQINNTKQSQFGADALRTLKAGADVMGVGVTPVGNAIGGAVEGIADTLEAADGTLTGPGKNTSINLGDLAKNAGIGAVAGLATAGVNSKIGNATSGIGSKLLNNKLVTSGVGRGAISGATGGAIGSGLGAAVSGGDILGAALQGAGSGALTGGTLGGITSAGRKIGTNITDNLGITDTLRNARNRVMLEQEPRQTVAKAQEPKKTTAIDTDDDFRAYGDSELATQTRGGRVADALRSFGESLEGSQTNITRAAANDIGIESTGKVVENIRKMTGGIDDMRTQAKLAKELTGGKDSLLDNIQRNALSASEDGSGRFLADTTKLLTEVDQIVDSKVNTEFTPAKAEAFKKDIRDVLLNRKQDLLTKSNNMKAAAADLRGKGVAKPSSGDKTKLEIYNEVTKRLDDVSYSAIPKENVEAMYGAAVSEMNARAAQARKNGNEKIAVAYETMAQQLDSQPHTIQNYRSFKKPFVDISNINRLTMNAENGAAQNMGQSTGGVKKKLGNMLFGKAVNAGLAKVGGTLNTAADYIDTKTSTPTASKTPIQTRPISDAQTNIYNILGRQIGREEGYDAYNTGAKEQEFKSLEDQLSYANQAEQARSLENGLGSFNQVYGAQAQQNSQLDTISRAMNAALAAGDLTSYNKLADLYTTAYKIQEAQNPTAKKDTKLSETQKKANTAAGLLDELEGMQSDFGYTVRDIPLLNMVNIGGNNYANTADALASELGYMLSGATIKDDELQKIKDEYIPQPFDSEATRKAKLQRARNIIQQYQAGTTSDLA